MLYIYFLIHFAYFWIWELFICDFLIFIHYC